MAKPTSWRSHRCHDCGRRTSRSRCAECRAAWDVTKAEAGDPKAKRQVAKRKLRRR